MQCLSIIVLRVVGAETLPLHAMLWTRNEQFLELICIIVLK